MADSPGDAWVTLISDIISTKVSVAYLHRAIHLLARARHSEAPWSDTFYGEAAIYYGMALRQVVEESFDEDSLHSNMVCSLFFIIFNILQDDEQAIQSHAYHACQMIHELLEDAESTFPVQEQLFWALTQAMHLLDAQIREYDALFRIC
jgi:hypothetical protein